MAEAKKKDSMNVWQQQIDELTAALQRERADSVNLRRQHEITLANSRRQSLVGIVRELLPVIDNLDRALKHVPQELNDSDYIKGIQTIAKQLDKALADLGVQRIKTTGELFDPRLHEAVKLDDQQGGSKEIVSEELQSGYMLNDEIIRHAMVNVKTVK